MWAIAAIFITIFLVLGWTDRNENDARRDVRLAAIHECAHVEDASACAARVQEIIKAVR